MSGETEELKIIQADESRSNTNNVEHPKLLEPTPPITPAIYKMAVTPSSPTSNKMSSNGESYMGGISQGSSTTKLLEPSLTPVDTTAGMVLTFFIYF